jgi:hypothetical protein
MSAKHIIKRLLLADGFDPFDLTQLEPPRTFRTRDCSETPPVDPFEGFRESMKLLGNDLKRGLEIYGSNNQ